MTELQAAIARAELAVRAECGTESNAWYAIIEAAQASERLHNVR